MICVCVGGGREGGRVEEGREEGWRRRGREGGSLMHFIMHVHNVEGSLGKRLCQL